MDEFCIEWVKGDDRAMVSFPNATRMKTKVQKLHKEYPEDVQIVAENKDGSICAWIPVKWVNIRKPKRVSDNQRAAASERLKKMHAERGE